MDGGEDGEEVRGVGGEEGVQESIVPRSPRRQATGEEAGGAGAGDGQGM